MIGVVEQRIIRKLCDPAYGEQSQTVLAKRCNCPVSYVNKVVSRLCRKNLLHKPIKNSVSILDFSGLLLYWAFTRDIQDEEIRQIKINSIDNFERSMLEKHGAKELTPALFWAAKRSGTSYTTYNTTYFYATRKVAESLADEVGAKSSAVAIIVDNPIEFGDKNQIFVDLISLNTWDSKLTAFKLAGDSLPIFGTRKALKEFE